MQDLEKSFLNCLLRNPDWIPKSISKISDDVFSDESGKWFFKIISEHYLKFGTGITKSTLKTYLSETFEGKDHDEMLLHARTINNQEAEDNDFDFYIDRLINSRNYRNLLVSLQEVATTITPANTHSKIDQLEERISKIRGDSNIGVSAETDLSKNVLDRLKNFDKFDEDIKGIPTPIRDLNAVIGGLRRSRVHIIAAPAGEGKSQLLLQFGEHANALNYNVVHYTLEMSYQDMEDRYHSLITKMDGKKVSDRSFTPEEKKKFYHKILLRHLSNSVHAQLNKEFSSKGLIELGLEPTDEEKKIYGILAKEKAMDRFVEHFSKYQFKESRYLIVDSPGGITIPKLRTGLKSISSRFKIGLLVIDYINLIKSGMRGLESWDDGKHVAQYLKQIAREYDIPVLSAAQLHLGKPDEKEAISKISQSDMRYSKAITENADYVIAFRRNEKDKLMGIIRLELIKHRHSESKIIPVREKFKTMSIENLITVGDESDSKS